MKISFSRQTKERAFKQLYEDYYAPFCLYAKRFVDDKEVPMGQVGYRLFRFAIRDSIGIYKNVCKKQLFELSETSGV